VTTAQTALLAQETACSSVQVQRKNTWFAMSMSLAVQARAGAQALIVGLLRVFQQCMQSDFFQACAHLCIRFYASVCKWQQTGRAEHPARLGMTGIESSVLSILHACIHWDDWH